MSEYHGPSKAFYDITRQYDEHQALVRDAAELCRQFVNTPPATGNRHERRKAARKDRT